MLYTNEHHKNSAEVGKPILFFLHGLLGDGRDWNTLIEYLHMYHCVTVDLPGHGQSQHLSPVSFPHTCQLIRDAIDSIADCAAPIGLVGYSLGARLIMFGMTNSIFEGLNISRYFLEGGNFGLNDEKLRESRLKNDSLWAQRFISEPIEQVLSDWYKQPVFASLNNGQRDELIHKRAHNQGNAIAEMLVTTSLAKQPFLLNELLSSSPSIHYICGEKDEKFLGLAQQSKLSFTSIEDAGHNVHNEQPRKFAQLIRTKLKPLEPKF